MIGLIALLGLRGKAPVHTKGLPFLAVAGLCQFVPWLLVSRELFLYHYFTVLPFLILGVGYLLRYVYENWRYGKAAVWTFVGAVVLLFLFFYPSITGIPVSYSWLKAQQWLSTWPL